MTMDQNSVAPQAEKTPIQFKLKRLRELRHAVEVEDLSDLSDGLSDAEDFRSLCLAIAEEAVEREAEAEVIDLRIKDLQARKQRVLHAADTLRNVVLQCMDIRGQSTIPSPCLTLSVSTRAPDVTVVNEALVPSRFFIPQPPKLDKSALRESVLKDGEVIEGVALGNGKISLTIRRK